VRRAVAVALLTLSIAVAGCSSGQDPTFEEDQPSGPTSSTEPGRHLQACPPGGPDETTPPAGCLDDDGNVIYP
jgi:hypothetical protein